MEDRVKKYFENPRRIKAVEPLENYVLLLTFDNGEVKKYNMLNELTGVFSVILSKDKHGMGSIVEDIKIISVFRMWKKLLPFSVTL